jgi:hypothetical protein
MRENFESRFGQIDDLLNEVEQSTSGKRLLAEIDDLCSEIDNGLEGRKREISEWSVERKRKEAADASDPFVLNLLSMDENFNIRTLSACNPHTPEASLRRLAEGANDYVKMVIANNPNCPADILDRISEMSGEQEVQDAVKGNSNVSTVTRYKIENRM